MLLIWINKHLCEAIISLSLCNLQYKLLFIRLFDNHANYSIYYSKYDYANKEPITAGTATARKM
jgi:hypothetical protein